MNKVAIVTDSVGCIPRELIEAYGITIVPPNIYSNGRVYRDLLDITPSEAYQLLEESPDTFSTSAPSPGDFAKAYRELSMNAGSVLCITLSSKVSTLYNAAVAAKELVKGELPRTKIEVLDSRICTGAEGFVVMAAARAAREGYDLPEVVEAAKKVRDKVQLLVVLDTIRYAYRTGRIPKFASQMGSLLNVKPVLGWKDGIACFKGMTRNKERGVDRILELMRNYVGSRPVHVAVHHTDAKEEGERLKERVQKEFDCVELWLTEFSPIMGYSVGRGALGLAFYVEE